MARLEASEILKRRDSLKLYYSDMHEEMRKALAFYNLEPGAYALTLPDGFDAVIPPTARAIVDTAVDHIVTDKPVVTVPRLKDTEKAQNESDLLEKFYQGVLYKWEQESPESVIRDLAKNGMVYGCFCWKGPLFDKTAWGKEPERLDGESAADFEEREELWRMKRLFGFPFPVFSVDPINLMPDPSYVRPRYIIESSERRVVEVLAKYPDWPNPKRLDLNAPVQWLEYWDDANVVYMADDVTVSAKKNALGFLPYDVRYAGLGKESPASKPEERARGILYGLKDALRAEARAKTAIDAALRVYAYGIWATDDDPVKLDITMAPGEVNHIPAASNFRRLDPPSLSPDLYRYVDMVKSDIERASYSNVLAGIRPTGVASGYMEAVQVGQARLRFGNLVRRLEVSTALTLSRVLYLVKYLVREPVSVYAQLAKGPMFETIDPEKVGNNFQVYVSLEASDPEENDRRTMTGLNLLKAGAISLLTFLEHYARRPNASDEIRRMMVEKLMQQPEILRAMEMAAAKAWGMEEALQEIMGQAQGGAAGAGGGASPTVPRVQPGVPPRPAVPGTAGEQDLVMRQMQRLGAPGQGGMNNSIPERGPM